MNTLNFTLSFELNGFKEVFQRTIKLLEQDVSNSHGGRFSQDKIRVAVRNALKKEFPLGSVNMRNIYVKIGNYKVYVGGINE